MKEKNLLIAALICSTIGIFIILTIQYIPILNLEPEHLSIINITKENIGETVKIIGTITRITKTDELAIINIQDNTGKITIIFFTNDPLNLTENQIVEISGEVVEYKGELEIEASNIRG